MYTGGERSRIGRSSRYGSRFSRAGLLGPAESLAPVATVVVGDSPSSHSRWRRYEGVLEPGDLTPLNRNVWVFEDHGAPLGQGTRDGIFRATLIVGPTTIWYRLQAYGDMAAAGSGEITVQLYIGDQVYFVSGLWRPTAAGWIFHGHHGAGFDR